MKIGKNLHVSFLIAMLCGTNLHAGEKRVHLAFIGRSEASLNDFIHLLKSEKEINLRGECVVLIGNEVAEIIDQHIESGDPIYSGGEENFNDGGSYYFAMSDGLHVSAVGPGKARSRDGNIIEINEFIEEQISRTVRSKLNYFNCKAFLGAWGPESSHFWKPDCPPGASGVGSFEINGSEYFCTKRDQP